MVKKIDFVVLFVRDIKVSKKFYHELLGMPIKTEEANYLEFESEGVPLALLSLDEAAKLVKDDRIREEGISHFSVSFGVEDVDKAYEDLGKKGVIFLKPPTDQPWGQRTTHCKDPDGNYIELYTSK